MRTVLIVAGIITAIPVMAIVTLLVAGLFIRKGHRATRSLAYRAGPDAVWAAITDWAARPSWRPGVKSVERLPDRNGYAVWREKRKTGPQTSMVIAEDAAERRMVTEIVDESAYGGTWTWEVAPLPEGGSVLSITEDGVIHNPIFRAVAAFFLDMRSTMDGLHRDLRRKFGEEDPRFV
ncbi:MAG: SRPBCC family protein [Bauldia sp.]